MHGILLNFMAIFQYFSYNHAYIIYLGYGHMLYMRTVFRHHEGSAWGSVGQC